jgi:hypothetical protein
MTKKYTQTGTLKNGLHYVVYQSPDMRTPLIVTSKYPISAKLEMEDKIREYKKAKK